MDITLTHAVLLLVTGFFAGIINTLAGGGSNPDLACTHGDGDAC